MRALTVCFMLVAFAVAVEAKRVKRSTILQFRNMINCGTSQSASDYNGYGCWCGRGGSGTPVDATDRCCRDHDLCYDRLVRLGTCKSNAWLIPWRASYSRDGCLGCSPSNSGCGEKLCFCDQQAVRCFRSASFNDGNKDYNKNSC